MLFNSFAFLLFFPLVTILYWLTPHRYRWILLLIASYYFYMNWKPVYALLILTSTIVTWASGYLMEKAPNKQSRKLYLIISLLINFGILFLFKYYNFINQTIFEILEFAGLRWSVPNLDLLLPVGISFYTFQAVGYTIDVYRGSIQSEKHFGIYALFVSFFPQLVAGPIERAKNLLPQFREIKHFNLDRLQSGIRQMIWGFFMKVVVADRLALFVNAAYNNVEAHNGTTLLIATIFFAFQIYCDFAGYSNIAIGAAKIMGFDLMTNFNKPYLAANIGEFWHKWHISLSTWFRDYVYIPLGGNRVSKVRNYFNVFITFVVSGIWHGANWTFVIWGTLHGLYFTIQKILGIDTIDFSKKRYCRVGLIFLNFLLVLIAWVFFRANSLEEALAILHKIIFHSGIPFIESPTTYIYGLLGLLILLTKEIGEELFHGKVRFFESNNPTLSAIASSIIIAIILSIGVFDGSQFIYFQF